MNLFYLRRLGLLAAVVCAAPGCGSSSQKAVNMGGEDTGDRPGMSDGGSSAGGSGAVSDGGMGNPANGSGGHATGGSSTVANGGAMLGTGKVSPVVCSETGERPSTAPVVTPGVWVDITPPGVNKADEQTMIGQGITTDPCNPSVIYWGNTPYDSGYGGLFRSIDGGANWTKLGDPAADSDQWDDKTTYLDEVLHLRIDPGNNQHFYAGDGVRGKTQGFWISNDSGNTWVRPPNFPGKQTGYDIYDIAVDPTDFKHALASFHSGWTNNPNAGVVETKDGGDTWILHPPQDGWGAGHSIKFLYDPEHHVGNANTWLLGTQGGGYFRTEDGGQTWKKVSDSGIAHGGGSLYYASNGYVYVSGTPHSLRSKDNGVTWETLDPFGGFTCVYGDGNLLYTGKLNLEAPGEPILQSAESDGLAWTKYNDQPFRNGPYEMAMDPVNHIIYSSNWTSGVWTLKIK